MKLRKSLSLAAVVVLSLSSVNAYAADDSKSDSETRMVDAKVVEVSSSRLAVIARTGVEHVIAINDSITELKINGNVVPVKELREGDTVTVNLDEENPMKFAKKISLNLSRVDEMARNKR